MINRIIPMNVMIPSKIKVAINPMEVERKLGIVGFDVAERVANMDQMKSITVATIAAGIIISIKLPVRPSFLPDSSDMTVPQMLSCPFRNRLFVSTAGDATLQSIP